jgi:Na+/phosphate symporter
MTDLQIFFAISSAIVLFLYALKSFSRENQEAGGAALRVYLARVTWNRWKRFKLTVAVLFLGLLRWIEASLATRLGVARR